MGRGWLVLAGLVIAGCGDETIPLRGDMSFSAEERADIERANVWMADHEGGVPFHIVWDLPHTDEQPAESFTIWREPGEHAWDSGFSEGSLRIRLAPSDATAALAAHEFGHMRGLEHHDGPGVMNEALSRELVWTESDRLACVAAGGRCAVADHVASPK